MLPMPILGKMDLRQTHTPAEEGGKTRHTAISPPPPLPPPSVNTYILVLNGEDDIAARIIL